LKRTVSGNRVWADQRHEFVQEFLGQSRRSVSGGRGWAEQRQELVQEFQGQFRRSVCINEQN